MHYMQLHLNPNKVFLSLFCYLILGYAVQAQPVLYGTTESGGLSNKGVLFSFNAKTATYTKLEDPKSRNFDSLHHNPNGGLVLASDGKYYGMTDNLEYEDGSRYAYIVSLDTATGTYTNLYELDGENGEGVNLVGSMVQALDGKLYGVTRSGGVLDMGTLFSFDPLTNAYERVHDFKGPDGEEPSGGLMLASDGKLYGVTRYGGNGFVSLGEGVIYSYDPAEGTLGNYGILGVSRMTIMIMMMKIIRMAFIQAVF
jgi:uncharacterized repeat protein (TIGR03803 family)